MKGRSATLAMLGREVIREANALEEELRHPNDAADEQYGCKHA
jgi:hypothetical protein